MKRIATPGKYHGKVLLFGEYSVSLDSKALIVPYREVSAWLRFPGSVGFTGKAYESNQNLRLFSGYLHEKQKKNPDLSNLDLARLDDDIAKGLYLESTIPGKYGLGSSGALCAAIYGEYGTLPGLPVTELCTLLAGMESFFHGSSSGIDPLCIFTGKPWVVQGRGRLDPWVASNWILPDLDVFLLDTQRQGHTGQLVDHFHRRMEDPRQRKTLTEDYIPLVNKAVEDTVNGVLQFETLKILSFSQLNYFSDMIPASFLDTWKQGLESGLYACKLCGSGGGGMMLGFAKDFDQVSRFLAGRVKISPVTIKKQ